MRATLTSLLVSITFLVSLVAAETHTWYFKTGWVNANPDGVYERPMIGFNDTWPLPTLRVKGDRVQLYLINGFDNLNTTLHFHGLFKMVQIKWMVLKWSHNVLFHQVRLIYTISLLTKLERTGIIAIQQANMVMV